MNDGHHEDVDAFGQPSKPEKVTAPRVLVLARWLWIAGTAVGVLRSLKQLTDRVLLVRQVHQQAPELSQQQLNSAVNGVIMFTLLLSLAIFGLYVLLAERMMKGRQWARVLMTLLGALSVAGTLITLIGYAAVGSQAVSRATGMPVDPLDLVFSVVVLAVDIAVLFLLYQPDSNRFFREAAQRADQRRGNGTGKLADT